MKISRKKGFTLVELVVVLVILAIIAAISIPFFMKYWERAEFRKNESNAKTIYLAAESKLTYYRASGQWEQFKKQVKDQGIEDPNHVDSNIYAITLDADSYSAQSQSDNAVLELIDDYTYDKDIYNGAIALEIDMDSGEVYSAFYGTKCKGLIYGEADKNGYLTMSIRDYESRRERLLGYYSAEDTVNTVSLDSKKLRITTISLQNGEKLSLNWSSNQGNKLDVSYEVVFYKKAGKSKLFSMVISPYDLRKSGWSVDTSEGKEFAKITLKDSTNKECGSWEFPLTYSDNKYSLVLDAMMSAKVQALLDSKSGSNKVDFEKTLSTNINRLSSVASALETPQDIYATVKATSYSGNDKNNPVMQEYRDSETVTSNEANTMFADQTNGNDVKIAAFRHLSNIRYYEEPSAVTFTLISKNMDWASVGTGVYDLIQTSTKAGTGENVIQRLAWQENSKSSTVAFPAVSSLPQNYTLKGNDKNTLISHLYLGEGSIVDDETVGNLQTAALKERQSRAALAYAEYLGLFCEVEGSVENIAFQNTQLQFGKGESTGSYTQLKGIGLLAGRSEGNISNVDFIGSETSVDVVWKNASTETAVGGVVGMMTDAGQNRNALSVGGMDHVSMDGTLTVELASVDLTNAPESAIRGIGGIVGYAKLDNQSSQGKISNCTNHADMKGNLFTGGIVGKIDGTFDKNQNETEEYANLVNCSNEGLILCTSTEGAYFGGIAGYGYNALIHQSSSASGQSGNAYEYAKKEELLRGKYVGGVIGYGNKTLLTNCSTKSGGYVLGSEYVGGIAGGLGGLEHAIRAHGGVSVTTNGNYVIGNRYVGGIVGENAENVTLKDCINNGVAVGYEKYVGGIVGYNAKDAALENCASYLSDYDSSIYNTIVNDWKANADYVGGIAGYNNGAIRFDAESEKITVKSVSSIVVGENYVGGVVGFNDVNASLNVKYTLIGGRIYASGNCVGGAFGLNASVNILESTLKIRPRSVTGKYFVGGCIGANVVNPMSDVEISNISSDNILGEITAEAFCGGVIGYQTTYTDAQIGGEAGNPLLAKEEMLLPSIVDNIPLSIDTQYTNSNTITIKTTNNIPIRAKMYAGGIVGYCEKNSTIVLNNCKNSGNIALASNASTVDTVNVGKFAEAILEKEIADEAKQLQMHFVGGIIGVNLQNHTIQNCSNTGGISGFKGIGGVVGLNDGKIFECELQENFGNAALDYVGGIAGINTRLIESCKTTAGKTLSGNNNLGGIVGWNLNGGVLKNNNSSINITGIGDNVGGIAGRNSGEIKISNGNVTGVITSIKGTNIGGIAGSNEITGTLTTSEQSGEIIAVKTGAKIIGYENVGGIVGSYKNTSIPLGATTEDSYLICEAGTVRAVHDKVGGITGENSGTIQNTVNRSVSVTADAGRAGGIAGVNNAGCTIQNCKDYGSVSSSSGNAGGITAENAGTIKNCIVQGTTEKKIKIYSLNVMDSGAICAINTGTILESKPNDNIILQGSAANFGGIVGRNEGTVTTTTIQAFPEIISTRTSLVVGAAVGQNEGTISNVNAEVSITDFSGYKYLGGIAGANGHEVLEPSQGNSASVTGCSFSGTMTEKTNTSAAGNCYGGIVGINYATLTNNQVKQMTMQIQGVYTANSSSTAEQKETQATHAGGIVGKNETSGIVQNCYLADNAKTSLKAEAGMLGGVTGFNKGTIQLSGSATTAGIMNGVTNVETLHTNAKVLKTDSTSVAWQNDQVENLRYANGGSKVNEGRLQLYMTANGNVGGITAFNGTNGSVEKCVSGNWFLVNKSQAVGVGTGGIIGMNESEKDLTYLVNGAFVGRQLSSGVTNRFAGGIIGNQNNSTTSSWMISDCINYGTVYCYNAHYSGGIMGQWTGTGGTIENCRNYGNLQTTYQQGWVGASGGIVAQLYHAYEGNEYNVVSCGNYGSIFMKNGAASDGTGANDSAGILGNITTYKTSNSQEAQKFTVRLLDCLNAPGVEIYSSSMASGIFGFLSCDNASGWDIQNSTCNVKIEVERCRNFSEKLKGASFSGGIFGARYSEIGWSNTVVKDSYSPNLGSDYYWPPNNPIYSNGNNNGGSPANITEEDDKKNNYYFDAISHAGYCGNFTLGVQQPQVSSPETVTIRTPSQGTMWKDYIDYVKVIKGSDNKYYFVQLDNTITTLNNSEYYLDVVEGFVKNTSGQQVGEILFYTETEAYANHDNMYYIAVDKLDNEVMRNSRESYRRLEGIDVIEDGSLQIRSPKEVSATVSGGKIHVQITPKTLRSDLVDSALCDPFKYEVLITDGVRTETVILYDEEGSFDIPTGLSGQLQISVRSVSMFENVQESEWKEASVEQAKKILPSPDIRAELIIYDFGWGSRDYRYQYSLNNLDEYDDYPGWTVEVAMKGYSQKATLTAENPTDIINISFGESGLNKRYSDDNFYQIVAKATSDDVYQDSPLVSTAAYLPYYRASIPLVDDKKANNIDNSATPSVNITGSSLEDLSINVTLDNSKTTLIKEVQPIYRVELLGTWKDKTDVVLAKTDVMAVSQGVATAMLTDLPDYIREATNLHVRIWFAQSGLGPVYTYHDYDVSDPSDNTEIKELVSVDEEGREEWLYTHTTVFEAARYGWNDFPAFIYDPKTTILEWLPAPVLDQKDGTNLEPTYDAENNMQYTFSWDKDLEETLDPKYQIEMTGVDAQGKEVTIDTGNYTGGRSFTIDGDDWNYTNIRLKVTRVGDAMQGQIGLSTTATYNVAQRLERPSQPTVINIDENELNYQVTWSKISDEAYCQGYQIYLRKYDVNGELGNEIPLGDVVNVSEQTDGLYTKLLNLEEYAGSRIVVYLVAKTNESNVYVDSALGVTYELEIPERLNAPTLTNWTVNWSHDVNSPVAATDFEAGNTQGLKVELTASEGSIPPGGSAYLLKAYVYDSEDDAKQATLTDTGNAIYTYPLSYQQSLIPIQMDVKDSYNYYHYMRDLSIRYAGKWIVYYARISSGDGYVSSAWVKTSEPTQLPYVKLTAPQVSSDTASKDIAVEITDNPDMPSHEETWAAEHTILKWNSINCADVYTVTLSGLIKDSINSSNKEITGNLRILENTEVVNGTEQKKVQLQQYVYRQISEDSNEWKWIWETVNEVVDETQNGIPEENRTHTFILDLYNIDVESNYEAEPGVNNSYKMTLKPELTAVPNGSGGFNYTLKLPDVTSMKDTNEMEIHHEKFNVTQKVVLKANVRENVNDEDTTSNNNSYAYVESDETEIKWQ